jgi:inner membrane transporter RhtA
MARQEVALSGLAIVAAQFSINVGAALAKSLFPLVGPEGVALLRTGISALILVCLARPWRAALTRRQLWMILFYGLALGTMNLLIYWAFERIPIGIAVAIEIAGPLSIVLLTSRSVPDLLWLALAVASLFLLIPWPGTAAGLDPLGIAFALGAAACWAIYIVLGKRASEAHSTVAVALGMASACLITVPVGIAIEGPNLIHHHVLGIGFAVAVLSSALPYWLEMTALKRLTSRLFGIIISSAPAVAALCGFLILGETLSLLQWVAVAAMIGASLGCSLTTRATVSRPIEEAMI